MQQYAAVQQHTLLSSFELYNLDQLLKQVEHVPGHLAEVGVYRGGTAKHLSKFASKQSRELHLFDTFEGMPPTDSTKDWHKQGDFADTSLDSVRELVQGDQVTFHKGFFPATATPIPQKTFSFVHIDVDIYQSVVDCCEFFYPRMTRGGIMLFDDYGRPTCPGAKRAVDEFFADKPEYRFYVHTGQCIIHKL
ncbi:MAG TPA: TylF/MycF/NovP-related O-methyltransferase [Phycisphaerae bacterium]|nr:TylF/MycF/NovP-related O-methyltransferase [Phycisphaerae bacterium]